MPLAPALRQQLALIKPLLEAKVESEGELWFLVSFNWMKSWRYHVRDDDDKDKGDDGGEAAGGKTPDKATRLTRSDSMREEPG